MNVSGDLEETAVVNNETCSESGLVACSYPTAVKQITFATKREDLDTLCPHLHSGLRCIDNYTRVCLKHEQRSHFNKLYAGTSMVIQEICTPGHYQEEFLRHAPCMNKLTSDYEVCVNKYQHQLKNFTKQEPAQNIKKLCGNLNDYLQCSKNIVKKTCGEETATFAAGFLDRMANSLLRRHCSEKNMGEFSNTSSGMKGTFRIILSAAVFMYILS